ncbi:MAG TPA: DUF5103 domain-containing protein [Saprospiraceae bacterium]|nr:DUF5103 domain-containing protein [Saprospiraceae bacterium]HMQ83271.1 DUF5103 domain-containing protein [Saprospiraceae bacterium]
MNRITLFSLLFFCAAAFVVQAQEDDDMPFIDTVYVDYLKSVKLWSDNVYPIVSLDGGQLYFSFDDIDGDVRDYYYSIVHCDKDWKPSNLSEQEYLDGFPDERIETFQFSYKTEQSYTNYSLRLPNDRMSWRLSGNYLLKIYEDTADGRILVITRRFVVFENFLLITPTMQRPGVVSKLHTHQEIDFIVEGDELRIFNPMLEVTATVLQNGRWDNAVYHTPPKFERSEKLVFDHQDVVVFEAGNEFRPLDLRNLRLATFNVADIRLVDKTFYVELGIDVPKSLRAHVSAQDLDGNFFIHTNEQPDNILSANYAEVLFKLETPYRYLDKDIYLFGAFTDWQLKPEYKLVYNEALNLYVGKATLKQGFYDYAYVTLQRPSNTKKAKTAPLPSFEDIEGNRQETINTYTILIYYTPLGSRQHRVIGYKSFSSNF